MKWVSIALITQCKVMIIVKMIIAQLLMCLFTMWCGRCSRSAANSFVVADDHSCLMQSLLLLTNLVDAYPSSLLC